MGGALFGLSGRVSPANWFWAQLLCLVLIAAAFALETADLPQMKSASSLPGGWTFSYIFYIAAAVINLCSTVKRYHDFGKSGIWYLLIFVPVIGQFLQFRECARRPGDADMNAYGPPPDSARENQNAAQSPGKFAKFDDAFFENYKAQAANAEPVAIAAVPAEPQRPVFGKRI